MAFLPCFDWWIPKNYHQLQEHTYYMGVSKNKGTPKWMVKIMENPSKMDDLGGFPPIFGNTHMSQIQRLSNELLIIGSVDPCYCLQVQYT